MAQMVKNLTAILETWVLTLGQEVLLEKGMATHVWFLKQIFFFKLGFLLDLLLAHPPLSDLFILQCFRASSMGHFSLLCPH